ILAKVGQFVDVFDAARCLENQRFESRRDGSSELEAERRGPCDHLLRIGDVGGRDLVHHIGGCVSQHTFGSDVEELNDALLVGGDAGEVGAVEDGVPERAGLQQSFFPAKLRHGGIACRFRLLPLPAFSGRNHYLFQSTHGVLTLPLRSGEWRVTSCRWPLPGRTISLSWKGERWRPEQPTCRRSAGISPECMCATRDEVSGSAQ